MLEKLDISRVILQGWGKCEIITLGCFTVHNHNMIMLLHVYCKNEVINSYNAYQHKSAMHTIVRATASEVCIKKNSQSVLTVDESLYN